MARLKTPVLKRSAFALLAVSSALGMSLGLARCGDAAAGPLRDLELLSREAIQHVTARGLTQTERAQRKHELGAFAQERSDAKALALYPLRGIYEPEGPDYWQRVSAAERALGVRFELLHLFVGWTPRRAGEFPDADLQAIWEAGSIGMVTWEPWTEAFESIPTPDEEAPLKSIALGRYDEYVDEWAHAAAQYGKPLLLRFAHEMNDAYRYPWGPQRGNTPEHYRAAFRHVHERFASQGASNVRWVWAPSISHGRIDEYYPGADAVDWVATGVLNYGSTMRWSAWWSLQQLMEPRYATLKQYPHPLMIAELGTVREGGDATAWYKEARAALTASLPVESLVLFHDAQDGTLEHRVVDFTATASSDLAAAAGALLKQLPPQR
jgi:Glycosyl hydrolase family 26